MEGQRLPFIAVADYSTLQCVRTRTATHLRDRLHAFGASTASSIPAFQSYTSVMADLFSCIFGQFLLQAIDKGSARE